MKLFGTSLGATTTTLFVSLVLFPSLIQGHGGHHHHHHHRHAREVVTPEGGGGGGDDDHLLCGTPDPDPEEAARFAGLVARIRQEKEEEQVMEESRLRRLKRDGNGKSSSNGKGGKGGKGKKDFDVTILTIYHIITEPDGTGAVSDDVIQVQHDVLNQGFAGTGFTFELVGITRTINSAWYNADVLDQADLEMRQALYVGDATTLNVYIKDSTAGGYATLPGLFNLKDNNINLDGVVINNVLLPAGPIPTRDQGKTAVHEVGQYV